METTQLPTEQPTLPKFLKTLCILTFVGVGLLLAISLIGFKKTFLQSEEEKVTLRDQTMTQLLMMNPETDEGHAYQVLIDAEKYEQPNWIIGVACSLLSLLGAIMMWNLKMIGLYLYVAGELLTYVLALVLFGSKGLTAGMEAASIWGGMAKTIAIIVYAAVILFDIGFIVMYALNRKHLK